MPTFDNPVNEIASLGTVNFASPAAITIYPKIPNGKISLRALQINVTTALTSPQKLNLGDGTTVNAYGYVTVGPLATGQQTVNLPNINAKPSADGLPLVITPVTGTGAFTGNALVDHYS